MNEILDFIHRRFPTDSNWTDGNCYYFAIILQDRFGGEIYYDCVAGHFLTLIDGKYYDHSGVYTANEAHLVKWQDYRFHEPGRYMNIVNGCCK